MNGRAGGSDVRRCTRDRIVETRRPTHEGEDETAVLNPNRGVVAARLVETVEDFVLLWIEPGGDNAESEDLHRWFNRLISFARSTPLPARQSERDFTEVNHGRPLVLATRDGERPRLHLRAGGNADADSCLFGHVADSK